MVETITEILACYDPIGLISTGCPRNEYEPEAENITIFVVRNPNATVWQIADMIQLTLLRYFNELVLIEQCVGMAKEIKEYQENRVK
jgi:hypothetical protein